MARLTSSTFIPAPLEEVFQHVTAFGKDGPVDDAAFQEKHGNVLSRHGDVFMTQEEDRGDGNEVAVRIRWKCTFEYPTRRVMEALDSSWADRVDQFRPASGGTVWRLYWDTHIGGLKGMAQYLVFLLVGSRRLRHNIVDPVKEHFEER